MALEIDNVKIEWFGYSAFKIKASKTLYIDPYQLNSEEEADIILITHPHYDHCSIADINKIAKDGTIIICPVECQSAITKLNQKINMQVVQVGDEINALGIKVKAFPAYNKEKQFHPKTEGWLGYLISINGVVIYHAGDTDFIPEMEKLTGFAKKDVKFIALLPVDSKFAMNPEEATNAAKIIRPFVAIPMHFPIEALKEAMEFCRLCEETGINVKILEAGK